MDVPDVVAINRTQRIAIRDDDVVIPITDFFDQYGEWCEPEEAVTAVAGSGNLWYCLDLRAFNGKTQ